ncbi:2138_t:CDS:2 [Entrophospora sp. SA101]|nr:2138_t:CDS:2 [Entrophospora sp. SA101]
MANMYQHLVLQSFGNEQQNYNSNQDDGDEGESDHDDTLSEKPYIIDNINL